MAVPGSSQQGSLPENTPPQPPDETPQDWLHQVAVKARGLEHGEIVIRFVGGRVKQILRTDSELLS